MADDSELAQKIETTVRNLREEALRLEHVAPGFAAMARRTADQIAGGEIHPDHPLVKFDDL